MALRFICQHPKYCERLVLISTAMVEILDDFIRTRPLRPNATPSSDNSAANHETAELAPRLKCLAARAGRCRDQYAIRCAR